MLSSSFEYEPSGAGLRPFAGCVPRADPRSRARRGDSSAWRRSSARVSAPRVATGFGAPQGTGRAAHRDQGQGREHAPHARCSVAPRRTAARAPHAQRRTAARLARRHAARAPPAQALHGRKRDLVFLLKPAERIGTHGVTTHRTPSPRRMRSNPSLMASSGSVPLTIGSSVMRPDSTSWTISGYSPAPQPRLPITSSS